VCLLGSGLGGEPGYVWLKGLKNWNGTPYLGPGAVAPGVVMLVTVACDVGVLHHESDCGRTEPSAA
jgi:hypothetical protein